jgi:hypothetical protein
LLSGDETETDDEAEKKQTPVVSLRKRKRSLSTDAYYSDRSRSPSVSPTSWDENKTYGKDTDRTRSTTKQLNHCLENQQGYSLKYTNTGKRSCRVITESSQEDYTDEHPYSIVSNRPSTYRTRSVTERLNQQDDYTNEHPYDTAPNRSSAFHIE